MLPERPISPMNPLGYVHKNPDNDEITRPCDDFNHTLAWVFWRGSLAMNDKGNFQYVRHLRNLILMGLKKRKLPLSKIRTPNYVLEVEVATEKIRRDNKGVAVVGLIVSKTYSDFPFKGMIFRHVVLDSVVDDKIIDQAMLLNRDLAESTPIKIARVSPFGPNDVVRPGNFVFKHMLSITQDEPVLETYRTIRLVPEQSECFSIAKKRLDNTRSVFEVQMLLETLVYIEMSSEEFNRFIHLASARVHKMTRIDRNRSADNSLFAAGLDEGLVVYGPAPKPD